MSVRRFPSASPTAPAPPAASPVLREYRCPQCPLRGREPSLLFRGYLLPGSVIQAKCARCDTRVTLSA